MSTVVCQNLVSCFESQLTETTTTLKLKLAAPHPPLPPAALEFCKKDHPPAEVKTNLDFGNWGFLQTLSKGTGDNKQSSYTYPSAKNSSFSRLSPKSLELCTENLGSETGTDTITDSSTIFSSAPSENSISHIKVINNTTIPNKSPKSNSGGKIKSFPPPLTTMSGSSSLQVRRHREGGRLIIEAVEAPFRNSYLQAERSDGRLRLCFLTAETTSSAGGEEQEEEEEAEEEEEEEEIGYECGGDTAEEEEVEEHRCDLGLEMEEFDGEINMDVGIEKFQRLSTCKEGEHGSKVLCSNWKPALWVATS